MASEGGGSALQGRFSELDPNRVYALRMKGNTIFEFIVNHSIGRIRILSGKNAGYYLTNDDLTEFQDPEYKIINIREAPNAAKIKFMNLGGTAAERANAFIKAQAEKAQRDEERATRGNVNNSNNPFKMEFAGKTNNSNNNIDPFMKLIYYFGLENVPINKMKTALNKIRRFYLYAHTKTGGGDIYILDDEIKNKLINTYIIPFIKDIPINLSAKAYNSLETYTEDTKKFHDFARTVLEKIAAETYSNNNTFASKMPKIKPKSRNNIGRAPAGNGTKLDYYSMLKLKSGEGGGRRRRRHTKRRSAKSRRTRRSRN